MLGLRATPERRAQLARQALQEIADFKARQVLLELQGPWGLLDRLGLKVSKAFLGWWERRARRDLKVR